MGRQIETIPSEIMKALVQYPWPGNVRELQNVIERSMIVCESETFTLDPSWPDSDPALDEPKPECPDARGVEAAEPNSVAQPGSLPTLADIEREAILRALQSCNGVIGGPRGAAARLGIKRTTLQARVHKLGIAALRPKARVVAAPSLVADRMPS